MGAGAGTDLTLRQHGRDEGQLRDRPAACCPTWRATRRSRRRRSSGSGSRCCPSLQVSLEDPEFIADAVFDRLVYGFHPVRPAGHRHARDARRDHARRSRRVSPPYFAPNNAILAIVGDVTAEEAFDGVDEASSATGSGATCRPTTFIAAARADAPRHRRQQARRRADRGARRPHRHSAQSPRLHGAQSGHPDSRRRGRQPPAPGAADRARPDLRRAGRHGHAARTAATSRPRPTRGPTRPAKCCG